MAWKVAWVGRSGLRTCAAGGAPETIDSTYVEQVRARDGSIQRRHEWKAGGSSAAAQMARGQMAAPTVVSITACTRGHGTLGLLYAIDSGAVSGVFGREEADGSGDELRLFHTERFTVRHVDAHPEEGTLACAVQDGLVCHLALAEADGARVRTITEGDVLDLAPRWVPGARRVVYQSAGLARDTDAIGQRAAFQILELDLGSGAIEVVASDPDHDLMAPRRTPDGALWYLKVPRQIATVSVATRAWALITWPWQVVLGLLSFLDLFRRMARPGDVAAEGGARAPDDALLKELLIRGQLGAPQDAQGVAATPDPAGVSSAWRLMRRGPDAVEVEVARGVFAWDVAPDGTLALTDGRKIEVRSPGEPGAVWASDHLVHHVALLDVG